MKNVRILGLSLALLLLAAPAMAENATCAEAQAMLAKAVDLVKADGIEKAAPKFTNKEPGWTDRDLYVFAFDKDGKFLAHGQKSALIGKSGLPFRDSDGKAFIQDFLKVKDKGSVDYRWADPSGKVMLKTSYLQWVGDTLLGVGCYQDK